MAKSNGKAKASKAKAVKVPTSAPSVTMIGHGIKQSWQGDTLLLAIDCSNAAREAAPLSSTGKSKLVGASRGWQSLRSPNGHLVGLSLNASRQVE